ncbi:MAG: hypothetical protein AAF571_02060, partial [Verrucomicrobiota bacterium]
NEEESCDINPINPPPIPIDDGDSEFDRCMDDCLASFGVTYEIASAFSPVSVVGLGLEGLNYATTKIAKDEQLNLLSELVEDYSKQGNRHLRRLNPSMKASGRLASLLKVLKPIAKVSGIVGYPSALVQGGIYSYCLSECL